MNKHDEDSAFPTSYENAANVHSGPGLTKREYYAALVLQGFCANPEMAESSNRSLANLAVDAADRLIEELVK